jgi:alanine-synthesizing transaminase
MFSDRTRWKLEENRLSRALRESQRSGRPIFDLTRSNPTECGFAYEDETIQRALAPAGMLRYQPDPRGNETARQAVCAYYAAREISLGADGVVLTSGTSEAYCFLFRLLCNPGDEVLIPAPGYPLFDFLADLCDVRLVRYALFYDHGWQIDFDALAAATSVRTRAVVIVHPNNPTGHYASVSERAQLADFCAKREIALIADEVFLDFSLKDSCEQSFLNSHGVLAFALSGISKICGLPQMKLAWIAVSGPLQLKNDALARLEVIADSYLSVGTPVQLASPALLATRISFQAQVLDRIRANLRELAGQLSVHSACNRLASDGGWSVVLRVPAVQSDEDLAFALLAQRGVHVHPGHFYDFAQPGHMVASLIVPEQEFAEGIRRLLAHFR